MGLVLEEACWNLRGLLVPLNARCPLPWSGICFWLYVVEYGMGGRSFLWSPPFGLSIK